MSPGDIKERWEVMSEGFSVSSNDFTSFPRQFPTYRWFKPLLVASLLLLFTLLFQMVVTVIGAILLFAESGASINTVSLEGIFEVNSTNFFTAPGAFVGLGKIAVMLPALAIAALIVGDRPFSSYSSSRGGFNRDAFFKCLFVAALIYIALAILQVMAFRDQKSTGDFSFTLIGFLFVTILVPIQAFAEEYVFRGFILQTFGAWTRIPAVGIIMSALIFAAWHNYNSIGLVAIFVSAVIWGVLAWQTKGIEATCAAHIVNNMSGFYILGLGLGAASYEVDVASIAVPLIADLLYAAAVVLMCKKTKWVIPKCEGANDQCWPTSLG